MLKNTISLSLKSNNVDMFIPKVQHAFCSQKETTQSCEQQHSHELVSHGIVYFYYFLLYDELELLQKYPFEESNEKPI